MARSFNGTTEYIDVGSAATLRPGTGSFTVAAWAKFTSVSANQTIYGFANDPTSISLVLYTTNGSAVCSLQGGANTSEQLASQSQITTNTWHHITMVRDTGIKLYLYVDSVLEGSQADVGANVTHSNTTTIGKRSVYAEWFPGNIGEVAYWNGVALSADEVDALVHGTLPLFIHRDALKGYWIPQWAGSDVRDWSQNGNNGTATGTAVVDGPPVGRLPPTTYSFASQTPTCVITTPDVCQADTPFNSFLSLPRSQDESDFTRLWDMTMQRIEDIINNRLLSDEACQACPTACGVVTLDLARCSNWEIDTDVPITQINMPNARPGQEVNVGICNRGSNPVTIGGWPTRSEE